MRCKTGIAQKRMSFKGRNTVPALFFAVPEQAGKDRPESARTAGSYVFLKEFLMLYSDFFHNVDTFYAYNETIVNIIITSV